MWFKESYDIHALLSAPPLNADQRDWTYLPDTLLNPRMGTYTNGSRNAYASIVCECSQEHTHRESTRTLSFYKLSSPWGKLQNEMTSLYRGSFPSSPRGRGDSCFLARGINATDTVEDGGGAIPTPLVVWQFLLLKTLESLEMFYRPRPTTGIPNYQ
jgi:hypothetical protein